LLYHGETNTLPIMVTLLSTIFLVMSFYDRLLAYATLSGSMIWMNETSSSSTTYNHLPLLKLPYGTWKPANYDPLADVSPRFPLSHFFPLFNIFNSPTSNPPSSIIQSIHPSIRQLVNCKLITMIQVYTFRNIRYAAPPTGPLRWAKPSLPKPLDPEDIQDGSYGPNCIPAPLPPVFSSPLFDDLPKTADEG
jgi:Carboxylesterase family